MLDSASASRERPIPTPAWWMGQTLLREVENFNVARQVETERELIDIPLTVFLGLVVECGVVVSL